MLTIAVLVFAIGAAGGLVLANSVLRGRLAPWSLSLLHAALGATGLVLTALVVLDKSANAPSIVSTRSVMAAGSVSRRVATRCTTSGPVARSAISSRLYV